jgi:hypothetical protein
MIAASHKMMKTLFILTTCFTFTLSAPTQQPSSTDDDKIVMTTPKYEAITLDVETTAAPLTTQASTLEKSPTSEIPTPTLNTEATSSVSSIDSTTEKVHQVTSSLNDNLSENKSVNVDLTTITTTTLSTAISSDDNSKLNDMPSDVKKAKLSKDGKKSKLYAIEQKKTKPKYAKSNLNYEPTSSVVTDASSVFDETTTVGIISTSIKTVPTTIKSTTLTTIAITESYHASTEPMEMVATTTTMAAQEMPTTETATTLNVNEMKTSVTADVKNSHNDNVIVLNSNSSEGLIVVDVMENFGHNASNDNESSTFEIKMDLIDGDGITATTPSNGDENGTNNKDDIFLTTIAPAVDGTLSVETKSEGRKKNSI